MVPSRRTKNCQAPLWMTVVSRPLQVLTRNAWREVSHYFHSLGRSAYLLLCSTAAAHGRTWRVISGLRGASRARKGLSGDWRKGALSYACSLDDECYRDATTEKANPCYPSATASRTLEIQPGGRITTGALAETDLQTFFSALHAGVLSAMGMLRQLRRKARNHISPDSIKPFP